MCLCVATCNTTNTFSSCVILILALLPLGTVHLKLLKLLVFSIRVIYVVHMQCDMLLYHVKEFNALVGYVCVCVCLNSFYLALEWKGIFIFGVR